MCEFRLRKYLDICLNIATTNILIGKKEYPTLSGTLSAQGDSYIPGVHMTSLKNDLTEFLTSLWNTVQSKTGGGKQKEIIMMLPKIFKEEPLTSLTLFEKEAVKFSHHTDERSLHLTGLQINAKCGPLVDAVEKSESKQYDLDTIKECYNVELLNQIKEFSINSILSFSCPLADAAVAVVLYYFGGRHTWSEEELRTVDILTKTGAWEIWAIDKMDELSAQASQLEVALGSRDIIGQAKGILMAQNHITSEQAFGILRSKSQVLNKKLRDIAEFVAMTGELPSKDSKWL